VSRTSLRFALLCCALLGLPAARPAPAAPTLLPDSTTVERWTLPNGLDVVTQHVPGAGAVSVTWGYRIGLDDDPADRQGLASLLAEVAFTASAGTVPERTHDEMESLRPEGWSLKVTRHQSLFTETATPAQFAGVLHQAAMRMRGVTVTDAALGRALVTVRRQLGARYFGAPDQMLHWQVREYARGLDPAGVSTLAAAKGLDRETPRSIQEALARAYVPANGVLALAGDLSGVDLHAALAGEFGGIPGGVRRPDPAPVRLDSATAVLPRPEVSGPVGVVGIIAPALTDSLHPSFYLAMLFAGTRARQAWGLVDPPLTMRFQYALLDDPELARFYPKLGTRDPEAPEALGARFDDLVDELFSMSITLDSYDEFRRGVLWLLGGPMNTETAANVRRSRGALNLLCSSAASRALWGSDAFWTEYRRRLDPTVTPAVTFWGRWLLDPRHKVRLMLVPPR